MYTLKSYDKKGYSLETAEECAHHFNAEEVEYLKFQNVQ